MAEKTLEERREMAAKGINNRTSEERSAAAKKWHDEYSDEQRAELARKIREGRARQTPEEREHWLEGVTAAGAVGGKKTATMRRRCLTCGMTTTPPSMGLHLKTSRHSGYEQAGPDG